MTSAALSEKEILTLVEQGLDIGADQRTSWIASLKLEKADADRLHTLITRASNESEIDLGLAPLLASPNAPKPGDIVGRFELLEEVGEGGMGRVFRARRTGEEFDQQVAIKFVHASFAGPDLVALFEQERRILATLQHPNIATLFDGGSFNGLPYVVMEHIDGMPIHEYVAAHGLRTDAVLRLMLQVCDGVQAAHAAFVVHRDLKPSNLLVTRNGVVKILDFGVAQHLQHADGVDRSNKLTPRYSSPEQLRGERTTTAADVYSLGVLLHRLLTGTHPDDANGDPLRGDLGDLVAKAMHAAPGERYASAGELAADLRRYLRRYPLEAVPRTNSYVFRKFVDRNRPAVALGTALVLALAGGLIATGWQFREALNERTNAEQVSRVLQDVILSPSQWSKVSHDNSLVLTADATVTELWTALEAYVATQELTPETKAQIYVALADGNLNLDRWEEADRLSQTAIDVHAQTMSARAEWQRALLVQTAARHKGNHPEAGRSYETLLSVMDEGPERGTAEHGFVLKNYGVWLWSQGDLAQAASHLERARDIIELTGREVDRAYIAGNLGLLNCQFGRLTDCHTQLDAAIELWEASGEAPLAPFHRAKASAFLLQRNLADAVQQAETAVRAAAATFPDTLEHYRAEVALAETLIESERLSDAAGAMQRAGAIADLILDDEHPERRALHVHGAHLALMEGRPQEASRLLEPALSESEPDRYTILNTTVDTIRAKVLMATGEKQAGLDLLDRAIRFRADLLGDQAPAVTHLRELLEG